MHVQQEMGGCENDPTADRALQQQVAVFVCSFLNCLDGYGQVQISLIRRKCRHGDHMDYHKAVAVWRGFQICERVACCFDQRFYVFHDKRKFKVCMAPQVLPSRNKGSDL